MSKLTEILKDSDNLIDPMLPDWDIDYEKMEQALLAWVDEVIGEDAETLAKLFHHTYETLAPRYGYKTREASAVAWDDVPEENKQLMIAVAGVVLAEQRKRARS